MTIENFLNRAVHHKYATVNVTDLVASASDNCDESVGVGSVHIVSVSSDEPENSAGDGNTINDIVIAADCKSVQLRSERMGGGNGRVYTITFEVTDALGNTSTIRIEEKDSELMSLPEIATTVLVYASLSWCDNEKFVTL